MASRSRQKLALLCTMYRQNGNLQRSMYTHAGDCTSSLVINLRILTNIVELHEEQRLDAL